MGNGELGRIARAAQEGRLPASDVDAAEVLVRTAEGDKRVPVAVGSFMLQAQILEELVKIRNALAALAGVAIASSSEPPE